MSTQRRSRVDFNSYVLGLITGKFEKFKVKSLDKETGEITVRVEEEFVPNVDNKYLPLPILAKSNRFTSFQHMLEEEQFINPPLVKDLGIFVKTPQEKQLLKQIKSAHKKLIRNAGFDPLTRLNLSEPKIIVL